MHDRPLSCLSQVWSPMLKSSPLSFAASALFLCCPAVVQADPAHAPSAKMEDDAPAVGLAGVIDADTTNADTSNESAPLDHGFEHGLRLGASLPLGGADGGARIMDRQVRDGSLSGIVGVRFPIWIDVGYRTSPAWWFGIAAQLGLGTAGSDCPRGVECEWSDLRLGAQAIYSLDPGSNTDPWLGLGLGWEWLRGSATFVIPAEDIGANQPAVLRAQELLGGPQIFAQGGLRFSMGEELTVGPYAEAAAGMFITDSYVCRSELNCPSTGPVDDLRLHAWIGLGVRGTHGP